MITSYKTIKILCMGCRTLLYKYRKRGNGSLVKCYQDRIIKDFTEGDLKCPSCEQDFARFTYIRGKPAHKIINGRVFWRK